jgi:hypothetical protein
MHSPLSRHELAHVRDASGPSPVRTMSITPLMTSAGAASPRPAGATLGHTSTHLPQRVQASSMSSMRADRAVSKLVAFMGRLSAVWTDAKVAFPAINRQTGLCASSDLSLRSARGFASASRRARAAARQ